MSANQHAGYVALLGRPNVGKSTLLNRLLAHKISITSPKPQTTRHAILGIRTLADTQIVYVDTPGLHLNARRAMNRYMNRAASSVLSYVDVVVLLVEALRWTEEDAAVVERLAEFPGPVILAVNKVDRLADKTRLLPFLQTLGVKRNFTEIIPVSAKKGDQVETLERLIAGLLPESEFFFAEDQLTTASQRFLAAELIREKLTRYLRQELPYALTVEIETFAEQGEVLHIGAVIWVERQGQKRIVIGEQGAVLKAVGHQARQDMEKRFQRKVFLETWVKVREGWSDDERALRRFGYQNDF
jgi:GTP-binding protein Era